jgi:hypothetical protein
MIGRVIIFPTALQPKKTQVAKSEIPSREDGRIAPLLKKSGLLVAGGDAK